MKKPSMKIVALGVFTVAIASCIGCATPSQVYWDHKVKELCEKDGGVIVYEKINLTKEQRVKLRIDPTKITPTYSDYYMEYENQILNSDPEVRKSIGILYRYSDMKSIAKATNYSRVGGDIIAFDNQSTYDCYTAGLKTDIVSQVFIIKGE